MTFRADCRAAAVELLEDYASSASLKLQIYRARPRSILPPCAFVDTIRETTIGYHGISIIQREPQVDVIVLHGLYDGGEATDQADAFCDGFVDYVAGQVHAAGANTTIGVVSMEDEPSYVPDWLPPEFQRTYFGTRITLGGFAASN